MGRLRYGHYADNVAPNATASVNAGTEDPDYPAENINDRLVVKPAQLTTTTGRFVLDFTAAQRVDWVVIPIYNLVAGLADVAIMMNATNAWGGPTVDAPVTIPTYREDELPVPIWVDLTVASGYSAGGFRYLALDIPTANATPIKIGEIYCINTTRRLSPNISWPVQEPENRPIYDNRTQFGYANKYDMGTTLRKMSASLDTDDAGLAAMKSWWRSCKGPALPFALVPDEDVNEAIIAEFIGDLQVQRTINNRNLVQWLIEETSRGLFL